MTSIRKGAFVALTLSLAAPAFADPPCDPPADFQRYIDDRAQRSSSELEASFVDHRELDALEPILAKHPTDPFVLVSVLDYTLDLGDEVGAKKLVADARKAGLDESEALVLDARIAGMHDPNIEKLYRAAVERGPKNPRANVGLARLSLATDPAKGKPYLAAMIDACPFSDAYGNVMQTKDDAFITAQAKALRTRLASETTMPHLQRYEVLWRMELRRVEGADATRKQIAADVARLQQLGGDQPSLALLSLVQAGYKNVGDKDGEARTIALRAKLYPNAQDTKRDAERAWYKVEIELQKAHAPAALYERMRETAKGFVQRWPDDPMGWRMWAESLHAYTKADAAEVERVTSTLRSLHSGAYSVIAHVYDRFGVHRDRIPALVAAEHASDERMQRGRRRVSVPNPAYAPMEALGAAFTRVFDDGLLVRTYAALGQPKDAARLVADLEAFDKEPLPKDSTADDFARLHSSLKSMLPHLRGHLALAEGRKADALALFLSSLALDDSPSEDPVDPLGDDVRKDAEQTFVALGGTKESYAVLLASRTPTTKKKDEGDWKPVDRELPAFALKDLSGKAWSKKTLHGKAAVIVMWATWCGPCKMEMPDVKALGKKLAGRKDAVLVSISVDEEAAMVVPFVKENAIEYPVLYGAAVSKSHNPTGGIPYAMIVDKNGHVRAESSGYDESAKEGRWTEDALAALAKLQ